MATFYYIIWKGYYLLCESEGKDVGLKAKNGKANKENKDTNYLTISTVLTQWSAARPVKEQRTE